MMIFAIAGNQGTFLMRNINKNTHINAIQILNKNSYFRNLISQTEEYEKVVPKLDKIYIPYGSEFGQVEHNNLEREIITWVNDWVGTSAKEDAGLSKPISSFIRSNLEPTEESDTTYSIKLGNVNLFNNLKNTTEIKVDLAKVGVLYEKLKVKIQDSLKNAVSLSPAQLKELNHNFVAFVDLLASVRTQENSKPWLKSLLKNKGDCLKSLYLTSDHSVSIEEQIRCLGEVLCNISNNQDEGRVELHKLKPEEIAKRLPAIKKFNARYIDIDKLNLNSINNMEKRQEFREKIMESLEEEGKNSYKIDVVKTYKNFEDLMHKSNTDCTEGEEREKQILNDLFTPERVIKSFFGGKITINEIKHSGQIAKNIKDPYKKKSYAAQGLALGGLGAVITTAAVLYKGEEVPEVDKPEYEEGDSNQEANNSSENSGEDALELNSEPRNNIEDFNINEFNQQSNFNEASGGRDSSLSSFSKNKNLSETIYLDDINPKTV